MHLEGSCHCQAVRFSIESRTPYPFMRCYCTICRKTAGGGGYAINIMGKSETLEVIGKKNISKYRAFLNENGKRIRSGAIRHFCKKCASCLWIFDPDWPDLIHPFASAIDTPLPKPPEIVHMMLDFAAPWCEIPHRKKDILFDEYPKDSIERWHKKHKLLVK